MRTVRFALALALTLVLVPSLAFSQAKSELPKADLKGFKAHSGLYTIHTKGKKAFLEVPGSQLKRPFILATSISGGPTYSGFQWGTRVASWERVDEKLVLYEREVRYRAKNVRKPMAPVVRRTYTDRVLKAAPIVALVGSNPLIDLGALFGGEAKTFFGHLGSGLDGGLVMVSKVKCFAKNVVFDLTLPDSNRDGRLTTLSYSLSELPGSGSERYRPRAADDRVGYFMTAVKDFTDETSAGDRFQRFIHRWNLAKADPSLPRSPVKKPIVFYIESTVPYRYRHAVSEGILAWNEAFAEVGLLGAMVVRQQQPRGEFADYDPEDVRYNFFRWIASERAFAMGPSRVNPYTGQILDADIVFDESMVRSYIRQYDLRIKRAPRKFFSPDGRRLLDSDPGRFWFAGGEASTEQPSAFPLLNARSCELGSGIAHQISFGLLATRMRLGGGKEPFPQGFMDQVLKDVVMHEVGHTLGLRHNFKASTWRTIAQINSEARPPDVCASVMDYNPINVQPDETKTQGQLTMRTLGPYDKWAIRFGYDPDEATARATIASVGSRQFAYATDEDVWGPDPYAARWDLGQDPLVFAEGRMNLSQKLWPQVVEKVVKKGEGYRDARRALVMLIYDYQNAAMQAARFVGGQEVSRLHQGDKGAPPPIKPVSAAQQRAALDLVCSRVLAPGNFALPPKLLRHLGPETWRHWGMSSVPPSFPYHDMVLGVQAWVLYGLTNPGTLARLLDTEAKVDGDADLLTVPEVYDRVSDAIFGDLLTPKAVEGAYTARKPLIPTLQRNLQRHYVGQLIATVLEGEDGVTPASARTIARLEADRIATKLLLVLERAKKTVELVLDPYTKGHLMAVVGRLAKALDADYGIGD